MFDRVCALSEFYNYYCSSASVVGLSCENVTHSDTPGNGLINVKNYILMHIRRTLDIG